MSKAGDPRQWEWDRLYREKNREKLRLRDKLKREKHPEIKRLERARVDPLKERARHMLRNRIRDGKVLKPSVCSECGHGGHIHGHHDDYSKPLDVVWLCSLCHGKRHMKPPKGYEIEVKVG